MLHKRIKELRAGLEMSQKTFGDKLGVSRDVIANIECNRVKPQKLFKQHLCVTFSVNPDWLETGKGERIINDNKILAEITNVFRSLNPDFQEHALMQIKLLLKLQEKQSNTKDNH